MQVYSALTRASDAADAFGAGGGSDPWTRAYLSGDQVNGTTTFVDLSGMSATIGIDEVFVIEFEILLLTVGTTNLPRLGVNYSAGFQDLAVMMEYTSGAAARVLTEGIGITAGAAGNVQMAAGTAPSGNTYLARGTIKGRTQSGSGGTVKLQLAAETAATNAAQARRGSEFRYRKGFA